MTSKENKTLTLREAFDSFFHSKYYFNNFLNFEPSSVTKKIVLKNKKVITEVKSDELKDFHRFLNNFVFNFSLVKEDVVFSYLKNKNILDAVSQHRHSRFFLQTDIVDFFGSISEKEVKKILEKNLINSPINDLRKYTDNILKLVMLNGRLPIGFATSPNISNSFLFEFDKLFKKYCDQNGLIYTRFADDIIVSSQSKIEGVQEKIVMLLTQLFDGFVKINKEKTKKNQRGNRVKLLGLSILPNGRVTVDKQLKYEIEKTLHLFRTDKDKFNKRLKDKHENKLAVVSGKLNYISTIDPKYIIKLRKKYGNFSIDYFIHLNKKQPN